MKFGALRSSVARLFETAATLVAPETKPATEAPKIHTATIDPPKLSLGDIKRMSPRDIKRMTHGDIKRMTHTEEARAIPHRLLPGIAEDIERMVREAMPGADVGVKVIRGDEVSTKLIQDIVEQAKGQDIKPQPVDAAPWKKWTEAMAEHGEHAPPGWGFCLIGNRRCAESGNPDDDIIDFVFGFVRGSFGIWRRQFDVCEFNTDPSKGVFSDSAKRTLTCITHLKSGVGVGLFMDTALAAEACELLDRSVTDLGAADPNVVESWLPLFGRIQSIWKVTGIRISLTHAHDTDGRGEGAPPISIFERTPESMQYGRPEKLS